MTRQQALEDLFFAVKRHLLQCGRNVSTAIIIADKVVSEAQDASVEDIIKMRNAFIGQG